MAKSTGLQHPTFGPCERVSDLLAVRWKHRMDRSEVAAFLESHSLEEASEGPEGKAAPKGAPHEPRPGAVNSTDFLSWVVAGKGSSSPSRLAEAEEVAWVAPVYRAREGEEGPRSYFAVNPTTLVLSARAAASVGDPGRIDESVHIDADRTGRLGDHVVLALDDANAIEMADRIRELIGPDASSGDVLFENVPYISPMCHGGSGSAASSACAPSTTPVIPDDTYFGSQWGLQRIEAPGAWSISEGDPSVVVAVLDQGVELAHPDLHLWPVSYSTITHTNDGSPVGNHGTACAGIIGARIDNGMGVAGLAGGCRVMAIATHFADVEVAEGLYYAADNGAGVVSMSFGVYPSWMIWNFAIIEAALQYCRDKDVVLVAASGNENLNVSRFPGSDPRTLCVGGSNRDDVRKAVGDGSIESWWGACYGPDVEVVAPCLEIPTTDRLGGDGYTPTDYDMRFNGTSSATPHVAALAGLVRSVAPGLDRQDVRRIVCETTDKINAGNYAYVATPGKPYGTWNDEVGYGRINAERALLVACSTGMGATGEGPCAVSLREPDPCCVSPCDVPWRPDEQCITWYEDRLFRTPLAPKGPDVRRAPEDAGVRGMVAAVDLTAAELVRIPVVEFRITYAHKLCPLGKQHGGLLYTVTLLPGETLKLYQSDRYRRVTSEEQRYSVQTTFLQFLSVVHEARRTGTIDQLDERLTRTSSEGSRSIGGGFFGGFFGIGGGKSQSSSSSTSDLSRFRLNLVSSEYFQSVVQASQLTHAERSLVISSYEDDEKLDVTVRTLENANDCHAVTYFVRQVLELYAVSTTVADIGFRILAQGVPPEWHVADDLDWLPEQVRDRIRETLGLLPKVGTVVSQPRPVSLPTDGSVYDAELAHCGSCEPEREAAVRLKLEETKARTEKACLEAELLRTELKRRRLQLQSGDLSPFTPSAGEGALQADGAK